MKTPYFMISEKELLNNINEFKKAFDTLWPNYKIAYSVKTNSLPWLLKFMNNKNIMAETVSDEEYQLSKLCGFKDNDIIFNGPIKTIKQLERAFTGGAIINIDSNNDLNYIKSLKPKINNNLGVRINVNADIFEDKDIAYKEAGFRFGFNEENGELKRIIDALKSIYPNTNFGLHVHVNTVTRSLSAYKKLANYTAQIITKYNLKPSYIDLGGGFFGGVPGKPTAYDYINVIKEELIKVVDINKTQLIVEPGSAICGSAFDFYTSVIDVKDIKSSRIITTDGSRINIDPLWAKNRYFYTLLDANNMKLKERNIKARQIICGYTCMDHDRLMILKDMYEIKENDIIIYHKVGNYTVTFGGMFIRYYPEVYVKRIDESIEKVRKRISVQDYLKIQS